MAQRFQLDSGLEIVVEHMPQCRSVATGVWARAGSAWESAEEAGISHFLEHMLFKGTEQRSARDIAAAMDAVGGVLNAFTGKEYTCFYARCLDEHWQLSLDLLADIYLRSQVTEADFAMEKNVIVEEINMYEDSPDDQVGDLFTATLWPAHPYGRPVIGSLESVQGIDAAALRAFYRRRYVPGNTVIAIAGDITPAQARTEVGRYFGRFEGQGPRPAGQAPQAAAGSSLINKDIEQTHVCLGFPGIDENDDDYYAAHLLTNILGGGMSSRLFQEVREQRGLSYSAYAYLSNYAEGGYFCAYASTRPHNLLELTRVMAAQILAVLEQGVSDEELSAAKQQLKGALLLGLENTGTVMNKIGKTLLTRDKLYDVNETLDKVKAVTMEDMRRVARRLIVPQQAVLSVVGPVETALDIATIW